MPKNIKRILIVTAGVVFIILGVLGLALPFLQGFLFLIIGLILLSISSASIRTWLEAYTRRYPKIHAGVERLERWIVGIVGPVD